MSSNINPNNIDGTYPVAGQDNDSQGFRDNFTNTKTNFQYAAEEISDLQAKAVLKSALVGTVLNNDMGGSVLSNAQLVDITEVKQGPISASGTVNVDYSAGSYWALTLTGNVTLNFTNPPPAGQLGRFRVQVTTDGAAVYTLTLPASVTVGTYDLMGFNSSTSTIAFNRPGVYEFEFETSNGGSTYTVIDQNRNQDPIYLPSSEDLASAAAVNLTKSVSYFGTGGSGETATLAAGYAGQIKMFAMTTDGGGDMVITVTNAAWGGAGTMTFADVGDACTMLYINNKWVCVGNNGVAFA